MLTQTNLLEILQKYEIPAYYFSLKPNAKSLRQQATSDKQIKANSLTKLQLCCWMGWWQLNCHTDQDIIICHKVTIMTVGQETEPQSLSNVKPWN